MFFSPWIGSSFKDQAVSLGPSSCKVDVTAPVLLKVCGLTGFVFGLRDWRLSLDSKSGVSKGTFPGPTVRGKPGATKNETGSVL